MLCTWNSARAQCSHSSNTLLGINGVLIDEYEFVVQPRLAGHGPTLFAGLSKRVDLKLVSRLEFGSGAVAMRYEPRRWPSGSLARVGRIMEQLEPCLRIR